MTPIEKLFSLLGGAPGVRRSFCLKTDWGAAKWLKSGRLPPHRIIPACQMVNFEVTPHQLDSKLYPFPTDGMPPKKL